MFNHCVLKEGCLKTLEQFLCHEKVTVVIDPPFGGRVEPLAFTINELNKTYNRMNQVDGIEGKSFE